jgi:membrane protease YdiL (CAAX protease family)
MNKSTAVVNALLSILLILFAFLFPHAGLIPLPFGYTIPVLLLIWLMLRKTHESFATLGFSIKRFTWKAVLVGCITGAILFLCLQYAVFPLLDKLVPLKKADLSDFNGIRHNTTAYVFILLMGWFVGGIYEEIVFHGYIFTRLQKLVPGKQALYISFICTNIIFGLYHFQLGLSGMLNAFFAGCVYHALMLRYQRNMWYAVFCHALFDTIGLTLIYLGYW